MKESHQSEATQGWEENIAQLQKDGEKYVKKNPTKAVSYALATGFCLSCIPFRRLLGFIVCLFLFVLKPALLILGGVKLFEEIQKRR